MATEPTAEAIKFFYEHAGYSYDATRETAETGRHRCAEELARAELRRRAQSAWVVWERDEEPFDDDVHGPNEHGYVASLWEYDADADTVRILASLGSVDAEPGHPYRRVVEAELALDVWP